MEDRAAWSEEAPLPPPLLPLVLPAGNKGTIFRYNTLKYTLFMIFNHENSPVVMEMEG